MWNYLESTFSYAMYNNFYYNGELAKAEVQMTSDLASVLVGAPRLRQSRMSKGTVNINCNKIGGCLSLFCMQFLDNKNSIGPTNIPRNVLVYKNLWAEMAKCSDLL